MRVNQSPSFLLISCLKNPLMEGCVNVIKHVLKYPPVGGCVNNSYSVSSSSGSDGPEQKNMLLLSSSIPLQQQFLIITAFKIKIN